MAYAYTDEQRATLITMLKYNLEIITDYMDAEARLQKETQLGYYVDSAIAFIEREGITLNYADIGDIPKGTTLPILSEKNSWYYKNRYA